MIAGWMAPAATGSQFALPLTDRAKSPMMGKEGARRPGRSKTDRVAAIGGVTGNLFSPSRLQIKNGPLSARQLSWTDDHPLREVGAGE